LSAAGIAGASWALAEHEHLGGRWPYACSRRRRCPRESGARRSRILLGEPRAGSAVAGARHVAGRRRRDSHEDTA
jgi:hypothetical protein